MILVMTSKAAPFDSFSSVTIRASGNSSRPPDFTAASSISTSDPVALDPLDSLRLMTRSPLDSHDSLASWEVISVHSGPWWFRD